MSTFGELQSRVMDNRFDTATYRARVQNWLNEAGGRVARRADIPGLATTAIVPVVATVSEYALEADHARSLYLLPLDAQSGRLDWLEDPITIYESRALGETDRPTVYTVAKGLLIVGPVPNINVECEHGYQRLPARMTQDTDTPELPEDYEDMLVTYAVAKCFRDEDDMEQSRAWIQDFESDLSGLKVDLREQSYDGPVVVPGTF